MYLEFSIPQGAGGAAAGFFLQGLRKRLHDWSDRYNIPYNSKVHKYTYRITFDQDETYTFFMSSWDDQGQHWLMPRIKDPMNIDKTR